MKVGFVGLGKLGLPVSVAMANGGQSVFGFDSNRAKLRSYRDGVSNLYEPALDSALKRALSKNLLLVDSVEEAVRSASIVFIAVPTPSNQDGSFNTQLVVKAASEVGSALRSTDGSKAVSVISTVLPGTMRNEIAPPFEDAIGKRKKEEISLCYNPSFIAMGSTTRDFMNPEFVVVGERNGPPSEGGKMLESFYRKLVPAGTRILRMRWEEAELTKMAYNTMIGFKIVYSNTLMEICQKMPGTDIDVVTGALKLAKRRITGPSYLTGGMGDGGGCHPRDNEALSWLARKLELSANPFEFVMQARMRQAEWIADLALSYKLPIVLMGIRYKPNTNLTDYSSSKLVAECVHRRGGELHVYDPLAGENRLPPRSPSVYVVALDDNFVHEFEYPKGSVVIDVWRCLKGREGAFRANGTSYIPIGDSPAE